MESLFQKPAVELAKLIRNRDLSPVELIETNLNRIDSVKPLLNAFVALRAEEALEEAKALAEDIAAGIDPGPLAGIPIGFKEIS